VDICLGRGACLHIAQLMPLPLTLTAPVNPDWFYLPGFTFLAHPGSHGQNPESRKTVVVVILCSSNVFVDVLTSFYVFV